MEGTASFVSDFSYSESALTNTSSVNSVAASALVQQILNQLDTDGSGTLSVEEANSIFLRINSRLGRRYGEDDVQNFFQSLDLNGDGQINLAEFKRAFDNL